MFSEAIELPVWVQWMSHLIVGAAMLLAGWRIWRGPSIVDRIVSLDLLAGLIMVQLVLLAMRTGFISYLDVAGAIAIISFLATVALARYLESKETSE